MRGSSPTVEANGLSPFEWRVQISPSPYTSRGDGIWYKRFYASTLRDKRSEVQTSCFKLSWEIVHEVWR